MISTIGYTEPDAQARIDAFLEQDRARHILLDIRQTPSSRWRPIWNKRAMATRYGEQYLYLPEFGNVNHQVPGAPIVLADPERGMAKIDALLKKEYTLMLMCACKDYERCHRKVVYELIMDELKRADTRERRRLLIRDAPS